MEDQQKTNYIEKMSQMHGEAPLGVAYLEFSDDHPVLLYQNFLFSNMLPEGIPQEILQSITARQKIAAIEIPLKEKNSCARLSVTYIEREGRSGAFIWVNDISEVKVAAAEAAAMLEMKSSFLAAMSHEIRTPMQSVYGLLELVADEQISDSAREMITTARKSASGLLEILDDILDLAKVEAGKIELDHFEIPLRTLAYGAVECMEVKLLGKPVQMITEVAAEVPFVIMGDPTRLRQVMLNLIGNAIKFTDKGRIILRIHSATKHISASAGDMALRFEIEDTGIGMSAATAAKLFQPFTQADNSTTRQYGGTGLGLSISHKLVELMGGKIGVESVEGKSSTFWFEIPTTAANDQAKVDLPSLVGLAVLSVEDHPKGAKEILSSLTSMGAKVESVPTYKQGIDLIKKRPFDVAVVDQGLPDGFGVDFLKEAAKIRPFMGLILYTVRNDMGMQFTAKVIGAKYLPKPASRIGLGEAVKQAARQMAPQDFKGPRRLLIAEDTLAIQDVLRRQLEKLGIEADFVTSGIAALKVLREKKHGILFTDLHMPLMDGYQLTAQIRANEGEDGKRFPVIALTADVQLAQRQAYLTYGFDECLLKPVSIGQLRQLLIRWGLLTEEKATADIPDVPPPPQKTSSAAFDREAMTQLMGSFDADTVSMLHAFIGMTRPLVDKLEAAFAAGQTHDLGEIAHSLKGSARSACCATLGDLAHNIQHNVTHNIAVTQEMITSIRVEFERAVVEIGDVKL